MFSAIKGYLVAGIAVLFAGLIAAIKILSMQNKAKAKEIDTLKNNAKVAEKLNEDMVEAAEFKGEVKAKAEAVAETIEELNAKTKTHNEKVAQDEKPANTTNITI